MKAATPGGSMAAFSVDVEDYFQVEMLRPFCPRERWESFEDRTVASTDRLLDVADEHEAKGTFFVLGWTADRHPDLVRRIAAAGHEIASHGFDHELVYNQSPEEFRLDVRRAKRLLEDIIGREVIGYRAPSYTVVERTRWALPILREEGYRYDSSVFPIRRNRYGWPTAPREPHRLQMPDGGSLAEFPMPTARIGSLNVPTTGGAYLRLLPIAFQRAWVRRMVRDDRPFVLNVHPWELDPDQPRFPVKPMTRITHYHGQASAESRLRSLLALASFRSQDEVLEDLGLLEPVSSGLT